MLGDDPRHNFSPRLFAKNSHIAFEAVDYPVFDDPKDQVLIAFLNVVALRISASRRHKVDDDRGNVYFKLRLSPESGPDHAVRTAATVSCADVFFFERV